MKTMLKNLIILQVQVSKYV